MNYIILHKDYCKTDAEGNLITKGFIRYSDKQLIEEILNKIPKTLIKNYYIKEIEE